MVELEQFRDNWILPKDFHEQFEKYDSKYKRKAVSNLDQENDYQFEKFLVQEMQCKGS